MKMTFWTCSFSRLNCAQIRTALCSNWNRFVALLFTQVDGSSLAFNRIILGILLLLDIIYERGLSRADLIWATDEENSLDSFQCRFPLFESITRVKAGEGMYAVYLVMLLGIIGVILGFHYRLSCLVYSLSYWYLFLIEKSRWNNHSYLFGLFSLMQLTNESHCKWSLDSYRSSTDKFSGKVPFWQYFILRFQLFLVYFYAGVKKTNLDWLRGYSMVSLSSHWVWWPWTSLLAIPGHWIDYFVIHLGGFVFDTSVGFLFLFRTTRPLAFLTCSFFNMANSQMFQIGMFPWIMLAVQPLFCDPDWPVWVACKVKSVGTWVLLSFQIDQQTEVNIDTKETEIKEIHKDQTCDELSNEIEITENLIERLRIDESDDSLQNSRQVSSSQSSLNTSHEDSIPYRKIPSRISSANESTSENFLNVPDFSAIFPTTKLRKRHYSEMRKEVKCDETENAQKLAKIPETKSIIEDTSKEKFHIFNPKLRANQSKNLTKLFGLDFDRNDMKNNCEHLQKGMNIKKGLIVVSILLYMCVQVTLPFAYPLLAGYNTWTNGLYGYSWDMMVHNWNHLHTRVTVKAVHRHTGQALTYYLNPDSWTMNARWSHHADMAVQFAHCVDHKMRKHFPIRDVRLYLDVWTSLNGRFTQRMYDPNRDILAVGWSPFRRPDWVMPVLTDSDKWRSRLDSLDREIGQNMSDASRGSFLVYIADFPGMCMENFIDPEHFAQDPTLILLDGLVRVQLHNGTEYFSNEALHRIRLPRGSMVKVTVFGQRPAYYALLYPKLQNTEHDINALDINTPSVQQHIRSRSSLRTSLEFLYAGLLYMIGALWTQLRNWSLGSWDCPCSKWM